MATAGYLDEFEDMPKIRYAQKALETEESKFGREEEKVLKYAHQVLRRDEPKIRYAQKGFGMDDPNFKHSPQALDTDDQASTSSYFSPYNDLAMTRQNSAKAQNKTEINNLLPIMQEQLAIVEEIQKEKDQRKADWEALRIDQEKLDAENIKLEEEFELIDQIEKDIEMERTELKEVKESLQKDKNKLFMEKNRLEMDRKAFSKKVEELEDDYREMRTVKDQIKCEHQKLDRREFEMKKALESKRQMMQGLRTVQGGVEAVQEGLKSVSHGMDTASTGASGESSNDVAALIIFITLVMLVGVWLWTGSVEIVMNQWPLLLVLVSYYFAGSYIKQGYCCAASCCCYVRNKLCMLLQCDD